METKDLSELAESPENSKVRAELWGDFVSWDNRWREDERFLERVLRRQGARTVLDVALGDGVDSVYLLKRGFQVQANEIDDAFRAKAVENARQHGFYIKPTVLDWRELVGSYRPESFDAVICLGNSLVCFPTAEDYPEVLSEFKSLLKAGGYC